MRTIVFLLCLFLLPAYGFCRDLKLVWSDEFCYVGLPDKNKWDYEEGFVRNEELQYYTRLRKENAWVENGFLTIEARKEKYRNPSYSPTSKSWKEKRETAEYTSASLITLNKVSLKYGRIEVRAKLPRGAGVWPAIWTLGVNMSVVGYPKCGEIDIMEYFGKKPDQITSNIHFDGNGKRKSKPGKTSFDNLSDDFHTFAIEWSEDRIDFLFDGMKYNTFAVNSAGEGSNNPFRQPHYLIINFALGGNSGGRIDNDSLPQKFIIDYVRIYKF